MGNPYYRAVNDDCQVPSTVHVTVDLDGDVLVSMVDFQGDVAGALFRDLTPLIEALQKAQAVRQEVLK